MEGLTKTINLSVTKGSFRDACAFTNIIINLIITMVIIIIRLNPSLNKNYFNYIDQHRLLACLQPKVVLIDVDHIIILFFMPTLPKVPKDSIISTVLVKCVNSANLKFSMMWKVLKVVHSKIQIEHMCRWRQPVFMVLWLALPHLPSRKSFFPLR